MATVTLPVYRFSSPRRIFEDFEIDELSFTRSIVRQGKGARAAWRRIFAPYPEIPQSHAVLEWNAARDLDFPRRGERKIYRAWLPVEEQIWRFSDDPSDKLNREPIRLHTDEQAAPGSDDA